MGGTGTSKHQKWSFFQSGVSSPQGLADGRSRSPPTKPECRCVRRRRHVKRCTLSEGFVRDSVRLTFCGLLKNSSGSHCQPSSTCLNSSSRGSSGTGGSPSISASYIQCRPPELRNQVHSSFHVSLHDAPHLKLDPDIRTNSVPETWPSLPASATSARHQRFVSSSETEPDSRNGKLLSERRPLTITAFALSDL